MITEYIEALGRGSDPFPLPAGEDTRKGKLEEIRNFWLSLAFHFGGLR
jgi:hypothetical protein